LAAGLRADPLGEAYALPQTRSRNGGCPLLSLKGRAPNYKGRRIGKEGRVPTCKRRERRGCGLLQRETEGGREGREKEGRELRPPKVKVSRKTLLTL